MSLKVLDLNAFDYYFYEVTTNILELKQERKS